MHIKLLGSGQEVGKSCVVVKEGKSSLMLDCGVKLYPEPPTYPRVEDVDALILSHAHLDHSGAVPLLYRKNKLPAFMNDVTFELAMLLIKDSMKVAKKQGYGTPFGKKDVKRLVKATKIVNYYKKFSVSGLKCSLYPSGHIPGSGSVMIHGSKKVFYTSDIQTIESHLLNPCVLPPKADVLIIESTYSYKNHPKRDLEEKKLVAAVEEALAREEVALIPVFAVGRAQEILLILHDYANKISLDGMAKTASDIIMSYPRYLKDSNKLKKVLRKVKFVRSEKDREDALKRNPIIISSAGMLGGGPAINYLRRIRKRPESKVLFCGFLVEESPGRNLIETKIFKTAEEQFDVHCDLRQFELSAHADRNSLFKIIEKTKPETVICVHGEHCEDFAKEIAEQFGINAFAPRDGETVRV